MGSRGAFIDINIGNFVFKEGGQIYHTIGIEDGIKYIIQDDHHGGKKVPDYSHSENTIYALIDNGEIKSIGIYDNHNKIKSIDLTHDHFEPTLNKLLHHHYHTDLFHKEPAHELSDEDIKLVKKIKKGAKKYL